MHCVAKSEGAQIHENLDTDYTEAYAQGAASSSLLGLWSSRPGEVATGEHSLVDASEDGPQTPQSEWLDSAVSEFVVVGIATGVRRPLAMQSMQYRDSRLRPGAPVLRQSSTTWLPSLKDEASGEVL